MRRIVTTTNPGTGTTTSGFDASGMWSAFVQNARDGAATVMAAAGEPFPLPGRAPGVGEITRAEDKRASRSGGSRRAAKPGRDAIPRRGRELCAALEPKMRSLRATQGFAEWLYAWRQLLLLAGSNRFLPREGVTNRAFHFVDSARRDFGNPLHQADLRNRPQVVAVDDAGLRHPFGRAERNFDRNVADVGGNLGRDELVQNIIRIVATQQQDRTAASGPGQVRPPDFVLLRDCHSSAFDQSSA